MLYKTSSTCFIYQRVAQSALYHVMQAVFDAILQSEVIGGNLRHISGTPL